MALTDKQRRFVDEYVTCFNAAEAARRAGYSDKTARQQGSRLLTDVDIKAAVYEKFNELTMSAEEVLTRLSEIARGDILDVVDRYGSLDLEKAIDNGKTWLIRKTKAKTITTLTKDGGEQEIHETEAELHDPMKALQLLAKYHALLVDRVKVDDWRTEAIAAIRAGQVTYEALAEHFDDDLATQLFTAAGVPIQVEQAKN